MGNNFEPQVSVEKITKEIESRYESIGKWKYLVETLEMLKERFRQIEWTNDEQNGVIRVLANSNGQSINIKFTFADKTLIEVNDDYYSSSVDENYFIERLESILGVYL